MRDLYACLASLEYFIDNEYLKKYVQLIERNIRTPHKGFKVHKHHILPRSWFKLTNAIVDNDLSNLVNLVYRDHMLAHYYLCLCTKDPFRYANELGLMCLLGYEKVNPVDVRLLQNLPMYNNIYEDYHNKLKTNYKLYVDLKEDYDNTSDC